MCHFHQAKHLWKQPQPCCCTARQSVSHWTPSALPWHRDDTNMTTLHLPTSPRCQSNSSEAPTERTPRHVWMIVSWAETSLKQDNNPKLDSALSVRVHYLCVKQWQHQTLAENWQQMFVACVAASSERRAEAKHIVTTERFHSPSTHSCSISVSMAATRSPTDRAPNTKSPIKRTFPQCLWMWQPRENSRAWNLARIHRGAFWPTALPWIWSRREGEKRTILFLLCYHT